MRLALESARRGLAAGEPPVGACLVRDGQVVARTHNAVIAETDVTAHAEVRVIREACRSLRTLDLSGSRLFVTVEPCAMCVAACAYAGIEEVVFGAGIEVLESHTGSEQTAPAGDGAVRLSGGLLSEACASLIDQWAARAARPA